MSFLARCVAPLAVSFSAIAFSSLVMAGGPVPLAFKQNEALVSSQSDLIDPEYNQTYARITWVDKTGKLWVASVDRTTGLFVPANGKGTLVDPDAMTTADIKSVANGPEWLTTSGADQIVYTKFAAGLPHTMANSRIARAVPNGTGGWTPQFLSGTPRSGPYGSTETGDTSPHITYVDPLGNHYWRDVTNPASETLVTWAPPSAFVSMRFVRGARATVFRAPINGVNQVWRYWLDTQVIEQLTFDTGHDNIGSAAWMWRAPEFGNDFVLGVVANDNKELRIYRQLDKSRPQWSIIYRASQSNGGALSSPEPFVYNNKSFMFLSAAVPPNDYASRIFVSNIDAKQPVFRQLTPDEPFKVRRDPEIFVTKAGAYIYYNRADRNLLPPNTPIGDCLQCSEGIFRAFTGLPAPTTTP